MVDIFFSERHDMTVTCILSFHPGDHDQVKGSISQQSGIEKKKCKFDLAPSLAHSKMGTRKKKFWESEGSRHVIEC